MSNENDWEHFVKYPMATRVIRVAELELRIFDALHERQLAYLSGDDELGDEFTKLVRALNDWADETECAIADFEYVRGVSID